MSSSREETDTAVSTRQQLLQELQRRRQRRQDADTPITRQSSNSYPLSYAQRRLWFIEQIDGPSAVYTMSIALRFIGMSPS